MEIYAPKSELDGFISYTHKNLRYVVRFHGGQNFDLEYSDGHIESLPRGFLSTFNNYINKGSWVKIENIPWKNENPNITSTFIMELPLIDPDTKLPVSLSIYKLSNGAVVGIDSSFLENTDEPVYSPYDEEKVEITIE